MWGGMPEGVCYSILIMNGFTPLIDRYIKPRPLGEKKLDFAPIIKRRLPNEREFEKSGSSHLDSADLLGGALSSI
jgi:Predicted NADH:ubiquinone oxidoreductase, subunit RnfD